MDRRILYIVLIIVLAIVFLFSMKEKKEIKIIEYPLPMQYSKPRTKVLTHVVIHFTSNVVKNPNEPYNIRDIYLLFMENGVSAHYVIDRKGKIYRFVPEERVAYHAGKGKLKDFPEYENKLNDYSIGIELLAMGTKEEMLKYITEEVIDSIEPSLQGYTAAQYKSLNRLIKDILKRNPSISRDRNHIIGHDEYAPDRKNDPGSLFDWSKIGFQ